MSGFESNNFSLSTQGLYKRTFTTLETVQDGPDDFPSIPLKNSTNYFTI